MRIFPPDRPVSWTDFAEIARKSIKSDLLGDSELISILRMSDPPKTMDEAGRPLLGSAVIKQHPEPDNFKWIVNTRRSASLKEGNQEYIRYADWVLEFFRAFGSFSEINPLFIISISTRQNKYEFLFAPSKKAVMAIAVGNLGKPVPP
jgi:hypothetical protein